MGGGDGWLLTASRGGEEEGGSARATRPRLTQPSPAAPSHVNTGTSGLVRTGQGSGGAVTAVRKRPTMK